MPNLKELRNRITSISSTMQITSAMKMVSASKLNKAQQAIVAMRPYANKLSAILQDLNASLGADHVNPYAVTNSSSSVLIVSFASNRGLAGAFNTNIIKQTRQLISVTYGNQQADLVTIGKKVHDSFEKSTTIVSNHSSLYDAISYEAVSAVADQLMQFFLGAAYQKIILVYNHFKNAGTQEVVTEQYLPIQPSEINSSNSQNQIPTTNTYLYEPSKEKIIQHLTPKYLKTKLFVALRDSYASEHGARMTAMHKATDNAKELRDALKLSYNKARQAAITNEILEIVGGADALKA